MSNWTRTDEDLALELQTYYAQVKSYGATTPWTIQDKGKPWGEFYEHASILLRKMRTSRRKRVAASNV